MEKNKVMRKSEWEQTKIKKKQNQHIIGDKGLYIFRDGPQIWAWMS